MNINFNWKPRPSDVEWTRNLFRMIADGGLWAIPANKSIWKLDKKRSTIVCVSGVADEMFHMITACCHEFGWKTELAYSPADIIRFTREQAGDGKSISTQNLTN